jgi:hypothetical protein
MDGDLLSIPEEAVARSPSNFLDVHDVKQRDAATASVVTRKRARKSARAQIGFWSFG